MRVVEILKKIKKKGFKGIVNYFIKKIFPKEEEPMPTEDEIIKILLLTNRDSDNTGDQVIEACDIALISTVMKNLGIEKKYFKIISRAASIVSQKYLSTKDDNLLANAEELIKKCDMVIFGGAPLFNYAYQNFYERTAVTLEIAQKYNKPVIFSAIGVEGYSEDNEKCQRLKKALNFDCVKQITTRDGYDFLKQYKENDEMVIGKVSDPAVFSSEVFRNFVEVPEAANNNEENVIEKKKKIGVFILRANGFKDNGFNFSKKDSAELWKGIVKQLESKGYDYELLTSGHFGDEAFLDYLIKNEWIDGSKCVFNINTPEKLIYKISTYDVVVSCRLHPSIISFSLEVPAVGIVWNSKVERFYNNIGYKDRIIGVDGIAPEKVVKKVEESITQGVRRDKEYLLTVYNSLFYGIRKVLSDRVDGTRNPYTYDEFVDNICVFKGTSEKEQDEKIKRKFRRTYGKYNELFEQKIYYQKRVNELKAKYEGVTLIYNGGTRSDKLEWNYTEVDGIIQKLSTGSTEYRLTTPVKNDGHTRLMKNGFSFPRHKFIGWRMRIKSVDETWYWYLEDKSYKCQIEYDVQKDIERYLLKDEELIPYIEDYSVVTIVLEAIWDSI